MKDFHYTMPVELFFGENCVKNNAKIFKSLGKRALVITYELPPPSRHYALEDIKELLGDIGTEYYVSLGVKEDPPISAIEAIRDEAVGFGADYIIAIGGGSAIDTAKCVSLLLKQPDQDAISILFNAEQQPWIPIVAIPTTCGTGSECTCWAAVTREDIGVKGGTTQKVFPKYAFDDARYIMELPDKITRITVLDALCHGVESYMNVYANLINRSHAAEGLKLFSQFKDSLLTNKYTKEDRGKMLLASSLQGMAITETGCILPHAMSYSISLDKHLPHGLAVVVTLVPYLKQLQDKTVVNELIALCGFKDLDEMGSYIDAIIGDYLVDVSVTPEEMDAWSEDLASQKGKLAVNPEALDKSKIYDIYQEAFQK